MSPRRCRHMSWGAYVWSSTRQTSLQASPHGCGDASQAIRMRARRSRGRPPCWSAQAHSRLRDHRHPAAKASCSSTPRAATSSGTSNTPTSTSAPPICSSPASSSRTRCGSASPAATIRKRSAAKRNGSRSGSSALFNPAGRHEQVLSDGRTILIEERAHQRRRHHRAARRHHRDEAARGVVPPAVRRQSGADVRLCARRLPHPRGQRRRGEALRLQPRTDADDESPRHPRPGRRQRLAPCRRILGGHAGRTWKHRKADGSADRRRDLLAASSPTKAAARR